MVDGGDGEEEESQGEEEGVGCGVEDCEVGEVEVGEACHDELG